MGRNERAIEEGGPLPWANYEAGCVVDIRCARDRMKRPLFDGLLEVFSVLSQNGPRSKAIAAGMLRESSKNENVTTFDFLQSVSASLRKR